MKTAADLGLLIQQKTWDKDLVLWVGSETRLREALGGATVLTLELLDLFDPDRLPMDDAETRSELQRNLRKQLRSYATGPTSRAVLLIRSVSLLARYRVGVQDFYDWFCNDFAMAVFVLNALPAAPIEMDEVVCAPERLIQYIRTPEVVKEVYGEVA